jgi:hypothetical protein
MAHHVKHDSNGFNLAAARVADDVGQVFPADDARMSANNNGSMASISI